MDAISTAREILRRLSRSPSLNEAKRRELLIAHLTSLFPNYAWQITEFALGAEEPVRVHPEQGEPTTGRIDTRKGALLIEYKRDLRKKKQIEEAETKLSEYVVGVLNKEGLRAARKCLSTDILRWREYRVIVAPTAVKGKISTKEIALELESTYSFSYSNPKRFLRTVERLLFEDVPLVATGQLLVEHFGINSGFYLRFTKNLKLVWNKIKSSSKARLCLKLWSKYVENCFDSSVLPDERSYLNHVYLVVLSRMIAAFALATPLEMAEEDFPIRSITGEFFSSSIHRVDHFVQDDFFRWLKARSTLKALKPMLEELHQNLHKFDFRSAQKIDLISDLYEQIMPPEQRAQYGEVLTPSWLVETIVDEIPRRKLERAKVLDPACGSGSFLRAVINRRLEHIPDDWSEQEVLENILGDICGLDINPVSIIIAKTKIILTLAEWLKRSDKPVEIPVFLCDSLFLPEGIVQKKGHETVEVTFDGVDITFPGELFSKGITEFDEIVDVCDELASLLADETISKRDLKAALEEPISRISKSLGLSEQAIKKLRAASFQIVEELTKRMKNDWNNVWAFVIQNTYRPSLLKARSELILCNPPWLAMSSFPSVRYKTQLQKLVEKYRLTPSAASRHHLEIATIFAVHCVRHYLRPGGLFAFVSPRVILSGDHHDPLRRSQFREFSPMKVEKLLDLKDVTPLFKRPACVIFGESNKKVAGFPRVLSSIKLIGSPDNLISGEQTLKLATLGSKSSYKEKPSKVILKDYYKSKFRQGADLMPRRAVMVDFVGPKKASILTIQTSKAEKANRNNKPPWDKIDFRGTIESKFVFATLKSSAVLPFAAAQFSYAALSIEKSHGKYRLLNQRDLALRLGVRRARKWFANVDRELLRLGDKKLETWLRRKNKLVDQSSKDHPYLVVYGAGGKNIAAAVINTTTADFPFVNDQTLYAWHATSEEEAFYVCAMLNSKPVNEAIKGHQPSGSFGEQHIHKLPLSLIPKFNPDIKNHVQISKESKKVARYAKRLLAKDRRYSDINKSLAYRRKVFVKELESKMRVVNKVAKNILEKAKEE